MTKLSKSILMLFCTVGIFSSCTNYLQVSGVAYQSIRTKNPVASRSQIPAEATIIVSCYVGENGEFDVVVQNNTDKMMTIDRTKSFFRNQNGNSIPYYDPTVQVRTQSTTVSGQTGATVNLGSIAAAAGVGGRLGTALGGVNVGGSKGTATTNTNTTYYIDQPQVSIAPHGQVSMGRTFMIEGIGVSILKSLAMTSTEMNNVYTPTQTYAACNLCVSYSIDEGKTYETIFTDLYSNSLICSPVKQKGQVNEALRNIYVNKSDVLQEPWFLFVFGSAEDENNKKVHTKEILNYK